MSRRIIPIVRAISFYLAATSAHWMVGSEASPNILFIFADDMTYEALGHLELLDVDTPNLDRLAEQGTLFTRAYNMGSWSPAVCLASRTMLNTGRSLWATEDNERVQADAAAGKFWSQHLASAGYRTYFSGKWHVRGVDPQSVFEEVRHPRQGMPQTVPEAYNRPLDPEHYASGWKPWDTSHGGYWEGGRHWSEVVADDAARFLELENPSEPFFLYLGFNAPHDPRQSPEEFIDRYPLDRIDLPVNYLPCHPYAEAMKSGPGLRDEQLAPFPRTPWAVRVHRQEYFALITHMDVQVGRILQALAESGKAENTCIIFTADHGLAVGRHGLMGKQNMYEHSLRVPLIISGPGIPAGKRCDTPVYLQDIAPTALELAGVEVPKEMYFKSLLPLLEGRSASHYSAIYGAYLDRQLMIIDGNYKLIHYPEVDVEELYNLKNDPHEMNNLARWPAHAPLIERLKAQLFSLDQELTEAGRVSTGSSSPLN